MSSTLFILCSVIGLTSGAGVLPDSVIEAAGDTLTFTTSLAPTETPFESIIWSYEGDIIINQTATSNETYLEYNPEYEDRITLFNSTGSLELRDLTLNDTGVYSVTITQAEGGVNVTGSTSLKVYERVSNMSITATDNDLLENDTVTFSCSASGSELTFLWFNGSSELKPSDKVLFTKGDTNVTVTIGPVDRYDEGSYSCKVSNPVSSRSDVMPLFVSYGPEGLIFKATPSGEHHVEGSHVLMNCITDCRPVEHRWFLDEQQLHYDEADALLFYLMLGESGNYSCEVVNNKTLKSIRSQPIPISVWEKIRSPLVQASNLQLEGSSVNLTCDASDSILTREWMFNGTELQPSADIQLYDDNRVLSFRNLSRDDDGIYTCNITNPVSSASSDYTMGAIYGPENVTVSGPVEIVEGATLRLSCWADSGPTPHYNWTKNGTFLAQSREFEKKKIRISDSGEYVCEATNEITMTRSQGSIEVFVVERILSPGEIAGITIAAVVVIGGAAAGGFYLYKRNNSGSKLKRVGSWSMSTRSL